MEGVKVFDCYNRVRQGGETLLKGSITERAGYIPIKDQIESFERAGRSLEAARKELYDYPNDVEVENADWNPFNRKNMDYFEAHALKRSIDGRIKSRQENFLRQNAENSEKKAADAAEQPPAHNTPAEKAPS